MSENQRSTATAGISKVDRIPPHSLEGEQGVIGCILLAPSDTMPESIEKLRPQHLCFYDLRHQVIYSALLDMYEEGIPIDSITLFQFLKDTGQLEQTGGIAYFNSLPDQVPSAANLGYYLDIVLEKYLLRKMIQTCTGAAARVFEYEGQIDALMDEVERDILRISEERFSGSIISSKDLVNRAINQIEIYHQNQGKTIGIETGFHDFDRMTMGLHAGDLIVIAARPSVGKSSLAMNIAEHVVLDAKMPVGVFSLEMTSDQLMMRMLCSRARVNLRDIRDGFLAERDFPKITAVAGQLAVAPIYIDDTSGMSILQLRAKARRMWQQYGIKLFVIDYLQLLHSTSKKADNRQQEIGDISAGLKSLAKELGVPVIALCQLNREIEKRGPGSRPRMSDLRESGNLEQDADLVGLLYREEKKDGDDESGLDVVKLCIAKQRNGPTGDVDLTFLKQFTRFESAAKITEQEELSYRQPHAE